jgi:hypothetical protein
MIDTGWDQTLIQFGNSQSKFSEDTGNFIGYWEVLQLRILSFVTNDPILAANFSLLLNVGVTSIALYMLIKKVGVSSIGSALTTFAFNLVPANFLWMGQGNIVNNRVVFVGAIYLSLLIIQENEIMNLKRDRRRFLGLSLATVALSTSMPYYVFFSFLFIWTTYLFVQIRSRSKVNFFPIMYLSLISVLTIFLQYVVDHSLGFVDAELTDRLARYPLNWIFTKQGGIFFTIFLPSVGGLGIFRALYDKIFSTLMNGSYCSSSNFDLDSYRLSAIQCVDPGSKIFWGSSLTLIGSVFAVIILIKATTSNRDTRKANPQQKRRLEITSVRSTFDSKVLAISILWFVSVGLWVSGGLLNSVAVFAPFFRSYSRSNLLIAMISALLTAVILHEYYTRKDKLLRFKFKILVLVVFIGIEGVLPSWKPDVPSNSSSDPKYSYNLKFASDSNVRDFGFNLAQITDVRKCYNLYFDEKLVTIERVEDSTAIMKLLTLTNRIGWLKSEKNEMMFDESSSGEILIDPLICGVVAVNNSKSLDYFEEIRKRGISGSVDLRIGELIFFRLNHD